MVWDIDLREYLMLPILFHKLLRNKFLLYFD
jgi:hypothetical protein